MTIDKARFRKPVVPGDTLEHLVELDQERGLRSGALRGEALCRWRARAEAEFSAMIIDPTAPTTTRHSNDQHSPDRHCRGRRAAWATG